MFASSVDEAAQDEAEKALAERHAGMVTIKQPAAPLRHEDARAAGWRAGEKVTLAHGVGASAKPLQIGGGS
ncbi:MAG: hypothetical protein E5V71_07305 [Mesorhizobium sp.]|nr:MAG: hypothetical protein E5V71_07305 [Mesorhizobium sp.]